MGNKINSKNKGVRYIASKLNKYFEKKYPTKQSASVKAKEILSKLKSNGEKVTIKNISKLIRTPRGTNPKKGVAPIIYRELAEPNEYFALVQYPDWIQATTNEVWFDSKISPEGMPMIQGGSKVDYNYFRAFVDYVNKIVALEQGNEDLYQSEWFVVCTKPNNKNPRKRWESQIIAIGSDGIQYSFGFDPKNPDNLPTKVETTPDGRVGSKWNEEGNEPPKKAPKEPSGGNAPKPKKQPKGKTPKKTTPKVPKGKSKPDVDAKSKVELKRLTIIEKIMDMFLQGKITKDEMNTMIAKYE